MEKINNDTLILADMGVHNNAHVPSESFPTLFWYAIEFGVILGIGLAVSSVTIGYFHKMGISTDISNWLFWGITGIPLLIYYLVIRSFIFKKKILE